MKNIYSDPEKSVMEALDSAVLVEDFLPSPSELVRKSTKEKITISNYIKEYQGVRIIYNEGFLYSNIVNII